MAQQPLFVVNAASVLAHIKATSIAASIHIFLSSDV
jgi:hypothetical protein